MSYSLYFHSNDLYSDNVLTVLVLLLLYGNSNLAQIDLKLSNECNTSLLVRAIQVQLRSYPFNYKDVIYGKENLKFPKGQSNTIVYCSI